MEKLGKSIAIMLLTAALIGVFVILLNNDYSQTAVCIFHNNTTNSPIWLSNSDYYPDLLPKILKKNDE